jgi:hypothetical protein
VGHHRALQREPLRVLRLLLQERERDQQGKRRVLVPGRLETAVQLGLDALPDRRPLTLSKATSVPSASTGHSTCLPPFSMS